jgi:hypothetical protein
MSKPRIYKRNGYWWYECEREDGIVLKQSYKYPLGAFTALQKILKQMRWRVNGRFLIQNVIEEKLLTAKEYEFFRKMREDNCHGITKAQYGYLKGLAERNSN